MAMAMAMAKRSNAKCKNSGVLPAVKKRGPGKPRIKLTPAKIKKMQELAYSGCQNNTIATLMGFHKNLIDERDDIRKLLTVYLPLLYDWLLQGNRAAMGYLLLVGLPELVLAQEYCHYRARVVLNTVILAFTEPRFTLCTLFS